MHPFSSVKIFKIFIGVTGNSGNIRKRYVKKYYLIANLFRF